ncbi:MAG TPA: hypothetical protein VHR72_12050, partial [Gemmataceae bacterium]|nr:hypothetical protein [Gemmataceae bacterium]
MCPETRPPSPIVRFLDSFLQERNIKWVLAVGMSILLGSSLLLVTTHWDSYTLLWQTLIVLGYSVAIHASGQWTYHRLGLRRTGLFLQGLTVLLIPILFLAVRWLPEHAADESPPGYLQWVLFAATAAFAIPAARRVFAFFLRSTQPTFLVCYLILSMSGALLSLTPDGFGPLAAAGLWATFAIGTMKASRHVFWLAEEHRKPRVFGFLPIALLGAQFLGLYAIHPALHVDLDWLGFGCMLVAIPVLATADALARVFEQRTGNLVRPLPWSVLAPIFVGLTLCSAAMALSAIDLFRPAQPAALLATTVGVSGLLLLLARRTGKEAFVWAMLFGLTLAYFLSPRFFAEAVNSLKAQGALAVNESKLPVAFYGVTFLPLLVTLLVVGKFAERTRCELFARPMRWFAFGLTCAFWMLSLTHVKAIFPVGVVLVVLTAAQLQVLRFWPALFVGLAAWVSAAFGFAVFANEVLGWTSLAGSQFVALAVAGFGLLAIGRLRDKWLSDKFPATLRLSLPDPCALTSLVLTLFLASCWLATNARIEPTSTGVMIAGLLTLHAAMRRSTPLAAIAVLFAQTVAVRTLYVAGPSASPFVTNVTLMLLGEWIVGSVLERFGRSATLNLFVGVHQRIVAVWLTFVTAAIHLPTFLLDCGNLTTGLLCPYGIDWPCRVGVLLWTFDCVRRWRSSLPAALAYFDLLAFVGCVWVAVVEPFAPEGLPIVWALTGLAASVGLTVSRRYVEKDIRQRTATALNVAIFSIIAATSLMTFDGPSRV